MPYANTIVIYVPTGSTNAVNATVTAAAQALGTQRRVAPYFPLGTGGE